MSTADSPTKHPMRTLLQNQTLESFPQPSGKQQLTSNILNNGVDWSKNTTEKTNKTLLMETTAETKKGLGKDQNLFDVQ